MNNQKQIRTVIKRIVRNYKPEKIYLFGSFAWGKPTEDSDVDLFIIKKTRENRHLRQLKVRRLIRGELPMDILVYTPQETKKRLKMGDFFIKDILEKGKVLYESAK